MFQVKPTGFEIKFPLDQQGRGIYEMEFKCNNEIKNKVKDVLKAENIN